MTSKDVVAQDTCCLLSPRSPRSYVTGTTYLESQGPLHLPVSISMQDAHSGSTPDKKAIKAAAKQAAAERASVKAAETAAWQLAAHARTSAAAAQAAAAAAAATATASATTLVAKEAARDDPVAEVEELRRRLKTKRKQVADMLDIVSDTWQSSMCGTALSASRLV